MSFEQRGGGYGSTGGYGQTRGGYGQGSGYGGGSRGGGAGGYQSGGGGDFKRLSQQLTSNIFTINSNVGQMQKMTNLLGTQRDNSEMRMKLHNVNDQTAKVIRDASATLKKLQGAAGSDRTQTLQKEKLSQDFQATLQKWKNCSVVLLEKEKVTVERDRAASVRGGGGQHPFESQGYDEQARLIDEERREELGQMDQQIDFNDAVILEREQGIKELESQMTEVNEIFRDLSTLVHEQGGMLDNIEANMSSTDTNVEKGREQLTKASHYQKKARNKQMCLLTIVAIVAVVVTIVLVMKLK